MGSVYPEGGGGLNPGASAGVRSPSAPGPTSGLFSKTRPTRANRPSGESPLAQVIGLLVRGTTEHALQETEGEDFGVTEGRGIVVGAPPSRLCGMLFEIIVHKDRDLGHLLGHLLGDRGCYTVHSTQSGGLTSTFILAFDFQPKARVYLA